MKIYNSSGKGMRAALSHALLAFLLLFSAFAGICDTAVPEVVSVFSGDDEYRDITLPFISLVGGDAAVPVSARTDSGGFAGVSSQKAEAVIFGVIPLKTVEVSVYDRVSLYPGGMTFGVRLHTNGVMLVGMTDVTTENGSARPAYDAGLRINDLITKINGSPVTDVDEVIEKITGSEGKPVSVTVLRDGSELSFEITPIYSPTDDDYKAGIWIRDSAAGIGTVTYINPADNSFAGLGHGITDVDTGSLMPMLDGTVSDVTISGITKGRAGFPGEIMGYFSSEKEGSLYGNTRTGIYGKFSSLPASITSALGGKPMPIALKSEVKAGPAIIYSTDGKNGVASYDVKISDINKNDSEFKNFIIEVTDPDLIELTGGIIQGMSGSPVIQNGHIIGAVTHVMINNPEKGYGIFIENMLRNTPKA